jgi:hypothetical protein
MGHAKAETTSNYCKFNSEKLYDEALSESSDDIEIVEDSEGEEDDGSHSKDDYPSYQEEQKNESSSSESSEASDADNSVARAGQKKASEEALDRELGELSLEDKKRFLKLVHKRGRPGTQQRFKPARRDPMKMLQHPKVAERK